MRHLILLVMLAMLVPIGFLAVRVGWPGLIAVITFTWAVYGMLLLKDAPGKTRVVFFSTAFVLLSLLIAWGLRWTLKQIELALTASDTIWPIFQLFAGSDLLQNFWAIVGGVVVSAVLFGLLFSLAAMANATRYGPKDGQLRDNTYARSLRRALGLVPAKWAARDGQIITVKAAKLPQQPMTGPGEVEIQRGHALILEKEGVVTDVLPAGVHWVNDKERIAMLVPLYGRGDKVVVRHAATRDGLQIEDLEIMIFHKVYSDDASPQLGDEKFRFNKDILQDRVWSASGSTWEVGVRAVTEREARNVIAAYEMEQLVTLNDDQRETFKTLMQEKINAVTREFMGVTVTVTGIGTINAPDLAAEKLMARWTAEKDRAIAWEQAVQQNKIMVETATARRDAFAMLFDAMNSALEKRPDAKELLAMSFVERMERVEGDQPSGANQDLEALSRLYVIEALKSMTGKQSPQEGTANA